MSIKNGTQLNSSKRHKSKTRTTIWMKPSVGFPEVKEAVKALMPIIMQNHKGDNDEEGRSECSNVPKVYKRPG